MQIGNVNFILLRSMPEFHSLRVSDVRQETEDTVSVSFDVPSELTSDYTFKQGQYLTLRKDIAGEDTRRSYSICSGVDEGELRVAIKLIEGGLFSTYANTKLKSGDEMQVMTPMGKFTSVLNSENEKHYLLIAAGSGITPMLSIIKSVMTKEPDSRVTLLYGNRYFKGIIFRDMLEDLKDAYLGRLRVFNILSGENNEIDLFSGRIDEDKINGFCSTFIDPKSCDEVFLCGPEPMINTANETLQALGVDSQNIHFELFTSPKGSLYKEKEIVVEEKFKGKTCEVEVTLYGQQWDFEMPFDKTVLGVAAEKGLDLPFSCKGGMCCTCRAKLEGGEVDMIVNYALEPEEVKEGFILTCQALPKSDKIVVNFDEQ